MRRRDADGCPRRRDAHFALGDAGEAGYDGAVVSAVPSDEAPDLSTVRVAELYPQDPMRRYEAGMLGYALGFYACYGLAVAGAVPGVAAGVLGVVCLLRYFNRAHEMIHADPRGLVGRHPARTLMIVMGPVYLGFRELREWHLRHHREHGGPDDPDAAMLAAPGRAALACLLQPELSALGYLRRHGASPRLAAAMAGRATLWAALMWLGGWPGLLLYNVMARVGNGGAFFVFSWVVHQPRLYGKLRPPRFPAALARAWLVLVGRENLNGIRYHYLHHCFPHVPDRDLPALSRRLDELRRRLAAPPAAAA